MYETPIPNSLKHSYYAGGRVNLSNFHLRAVKSSGNYPFNMFIHCGQLRHRSRMCETAKDRLTDKYKLRCIFHKVIQVRRTHFKWEPEVKLVIVFFRVTISLTRVVPLGS